MSLRGYSFQLVKANKAADQKLIGVQLGRVMINNNVPVAEVARRFGVSRQTIYNWFTGVGKPTPRKTEIIRDVLKHFST
jgi:transcriptional regulator with XRE-family HTH domain